MDQPTKQSRPDLATERRTAPRYTVHEDIEYTLLSGSRSGNRGRARLVEISTHGLKLASDDLVAGVRIEVILPWISSRPETADLYLQVMGRTVRAEGGYAVVEIEKSDFRLSKAE